MANKNSRSLMDRSLWPTVVLLVAVFIIFEKTNFDILVQDFFYDFPTHSWWVDAKSPIPRLIFYTGPKVFIFIIAACAIALCLMRSKSRFQLLKKVVRRGDLLVLIATLAVAPALVALCKAKSNVFCPYEITRYGGDQPYVRVLESYPDGHFPQLRGRGFPAGHASGGFALMCLAGGATTTRGRILGAAIGFSLGSTMGLYQMLKGAHYLSHTLITWLFCWIIFLLMRRIFLPRVSPS